jgi:hypothetical protein
VPAVLVAASLWTVRGYALAENRPEERTVDGV